MTVTIRRGNDPFKKYWWAILLGFGGVGGWICLPLLDSGGTGSVVAVREQGLQAVGQSLDSMGNPQGAPGGVVDLSMEGTYRRRKDGSTMVSSLYQAPEEPAEAQATVSASGSSYADALRDISRKSAAADPTGWGGKQPYRPFTPPKANLGNMSGLGGGSSSGASASSSGFGGPTSSGAFGISGPKTGVTFAKGLGSGIADPAIANAKGKSMAALQGAASAMSRAANTGSADLAAGMAQGVFDGSRGGGTIGGGGAGTSGGGIYGSLDAAPINLKVNDPKLNQAEFTPPAPKVTDEKPSFREEIMKMILMALVGGLVSGFTGMLTGSLFGGGAKPTASLHHYSPDLDLDAVLYSYRRPGHGLPQIA